LTSPPRFDGLTQMGIGITVRVTRCAPNRGSVLIAPTEERIELEISNSVEASAHVYNRLDCAGIDCGFIASKIVHKRGQGFWLDIALGIVGAIVGGFLFESLGTEGITGFNLSSMIVAIIGAIVVLLAYHAIAGRRPT
jgi:uncharacterized membrane protein YeaQ/YmgE (transglycosylase-associated protein family)